MNDSIYEEYMRSVLGYQPMNNYNTYDMNFDNWEMPNMTAMSNPQMQELEDCYPEIYRIVYPMIQKACNQNTRPVTRELIDSMTDEIYFAIEDREMVENRGKEEKTGKSTTQVAEDRQIIVRNTRLNDLIRILILRELLGRPGFPGGRPPRPRPPRPPMRPPMGPPPRPQPRPGMGLFNRNVYGQYEDLYEY
ncbi:MAG: hypothetical protein IJE68_00885 [Clostridia bacterium]|nr:hypothetical protein [Clostridia bacterium]